MVSDVEVSDGNESTSNVVHSNPTHSAVMDEAISGPLRISMMEGGLQKQS